MKSLNSPDKELKPFWRSDGMDWIADLTQMKRAVLVAFYLPKVPIKNTSYYSISPRSYFPFTNEQHDKKFDEYYDCCIYAESIIRDWINSLLLDEKVFNNIKPLDSQETKKIPIAVPKFGGEVK